MQIRTVMIVGGGSSGWMTAAALSKLCPHLKISLVESDKIGTIGVGESTLGHINKFFGLLGLKDEEWMPACNATYKNSIRFTNFRENDGTYFEYPFSAGLDFTDKPNGVGAWSELATLYPDEYTPETFAEFYCTGNTMLAKYNKQTRNEQNILRNYEFAWDTAYHLDAGLLGQYLKEKIALPNGVNHIIGEIHSYKKDYLGNLSDVLCRDGTILRADLWIDCTGFNSILLEGWMGSEFRPFDSHLANDSAWACRIPYEDREKEMHNVTDCHALGNGWVWNIPLWNRIGTGYCYSSKFTTDEEAKREFRKHLETTGSKERAENAEMMHIKIKHGRRRRAWVQNVVGVGLSYGFVEPLESTGLLTTHENIIKLVEQLNRRQGYLTRTEIEGFNFAVENEVLRFRDFVSQHYALSQRTDTPYWRWCTQLHEYCPDQMGDFMLNQAQYPNMMGNIVGNQRYFSEYIGNMFIAGGMGVKSISTKELIFVNGSRLTRNLKQEEIGYTKRRYEEYRDYVIDYVSKLPSHYEFLKNEIYGGKDDYAL
ncbi:Flavin-dependent halogenase [uncultured Caudovirales phage]|uniref:Flavin-dependent halogenase n=1 Tax=uncultured Caudovirales phage TaxID=2100421 RepID=A0A6J5KV40_9CAUD|nr:Flavin-dependent halogenase [uncultured Caudovirales phage]CAB5209228.1 Flavin-dependent halogenase [uncultured Caudovirales phage]